MFRKILLAALVVGILLAYQNCGNYPSSASAGKDGGVGKIDPEPEESQKSDDELIQYNIAVSATSFHSSGQLPDSLYNTIQDKIHECENSIGPDRTNCQWSLVEVYQRILEGGLGFQTTKSGDCVALYKAEEGQLRANIEYICRRDHVLAQYGPTFLETDQCPADGTEAVTYGIRSRHFYRLSLPLNLPEGIPIQLKLRALDKINGYNAIDACGKSHQVADLGIEFSI